MMNEKVSQKVLEELREDDTLVVWKLDRLGRTVKQLLNLIEDLKGRGIHFKSIKDKIDTTTATGTFFFHVMASFAQLERELTLERTMAGLNAARTRGRYGGRPLIHKTDKKEMAYEM
jgi:DNA invertase Pin-like site-specific DNA recombinase